MKGYIARAMQVSCLIRDQLERVQAREKIRGYLIPNWNIQSAFSLPSIKETYGIPDDPEVQSAHNQRIESEIQKNNFTKIDGVTDGGLEWQHAFDWVVFNNRDQVNWECVGTRRRGKLRNLVGNPSRQNDLELVDGEYGD